MSQKMPFRVLLTGHAKNELARETAKNARDLLEKHGITTLVDATFLHTQHGVAAKTTPADLAFVFGGDGALLHFIREREKQLPVFGVNCGAVGKLMAVHHNRLQEYLTRNTLMHLTPKQHTRFSCSIDEKSGVQALNDVLVVPEKPGVLLRYDLFIDNEFQFRDMADGILFSTATGSAAYAVSGINPVIHSSARVFVIRAMNSLSYRQPIITADASVLRIANLDCRLRLEAVIDGQERMRVHDQVELKKSAQPARIIPHQPRVREEREHLEAASPSAKYLYRLLAEKGSLTQREMVKETGLQQRTVQRALDFLAQHELVLRQPLFANRKQKLYSIRDAR